MLTLHLNVSDGVGGRSGCSRLCPQYHPWPPETINMIHALITHVSGLKKISILAVSPALSFEYLKLIKYESLLSFIRALKASIKRQN